jgi:hypothetical protein
MPGPFQTGRPKLAMLQQVLKRFVVLSRSLSLSVSLKGSWMLDGFAESFH